MSSPTMLTRRTRTPRLKSCSHARRTFSSPIFPFMISSPMTSKPTDRGCIQVARPDTRTISQAHGYARGARGDLCAHPGPAPVAQS
eukprot:scaffold4219_cov618-Prasinococcus_capsulatus_cf.AAC.3